MTYIQDEDDEALRTLNNQLACECCAESSGIKQGGGDNNNNNNIREVFCVVVCTGRLPSLVA